MTAAKSRARAVTSTSAWLLCGGATPMETRLSASETMSPFAKPSAITPMAPHMAGGKVPTMPKSMNPTLASPPSSSSSSSSSKKLPPCTSAWKKSHLRTDTHHTVNAPTRADSPLLGALGSSLSIISSPLPSRASFLSSLFFPPPLSPLFSSSALSRGAPRRRVMVSTLSEQSSWMGCGQVARWVSSSSSRNWRNTRSLSASVRRSNSPTMELRRSEAMLATDSLEASGARASTKLAATVRSARSVRRVASTPGLRTLSTTSRAVALLPPSPSSTLLFNTAV
mmetsp:Transcript_3442/g.6819  ORF Transcript_3442/g.6819 Transcript_3442/m.6819 type:complete len:282 (-) Transcript_3442:46-891(-)